jgi:DNA-binding GntR family transcriptional regulator
MQTTPQRERSSSSLPSVGEGGERLADRVYEALRFAIHDGTLAPGTRLRQEALADELGVSRTPLREALLRLERAGLVEAVPRRGWVVPGLSLETIRHLYEARELIEAHAVAGAAAAQTPQTLEAIEAAYDVLLLAAERGLLDSFHAHRSFHRTLVAAYENDVIKDELERLFDRDASLPMFALYSRDHEALRAMAREHGEFVETLTSGDPGAARAAALRHISGSLARVEQEFALQRGTAGKGVSEGRINGNTGS